MIAVTGDTHREFERIESFCEECCTTKEDILIILGDAGINFFLDESDYALKRELSELPVTLLCVHGNHEERPFNIDTYEEKPWHGGLVYMEPEFPSLLFAKDGEIYDFGGKKAVVLAVDKTTEEWLDRIDVLPMKTGSAGTTTSTTRRDRSASCRTSSSSWTRTACGRIDGGGVVWKRDCFCCIFPVISTVI